VGRDPDKLSKGTLTHIEWKMFNHIDARDDRKGPVCKREIQH
jgi:hypothetical protein